MKNHAIYTLAIAGALVAVDASASVNPNQIENNVMRRVIADVQHLTQINTREAIQDWEQSWPQWNPTGC